MSTVYVDTGAFIALLWTRDRAHTRMRDAFEVLRAERSRLVTCDAVVGETTTRLRYDAGLRRALAFHEVLDRAVTVGQLEIVASNPTLRAETVARLAMFEGLRLSYADAFGSVVASRVDADAVLGLAADFRVLGHRLLPE